MMKKSFFSFLILVCLVSVLSVASAVDRWEKITESPKAIWYFDLKTYTYDAKTVDVWIKAEGKDQNQKFLSHNIIDRKTKKYFTNEVVRYDLKSGESYSFNEKDKGWRSATPGSIFESVIDHMVAFADYLEKNPD